MRLISEADVVIALGTRLGPFGTLPQHDMDYWPADAKIIQIDADNKMLGLVKPISVGIHGDAGEAAVALLERIADRELACDATRDARAAKTAEEKQRWEDELDAWMSESDDWSVEAIENAKDMPGDWLSPRAVLRELEKACLLYTSPSPRDQRGSRMPSSA